MSIVPSVFMMLLAASLVAISIAQSQLEIVLGQGPPAAQPMQRDSQVLAQQPQPPAATTNPAPTTQIPNQGQMLRPEAGLPAKLTQLSEEDMLLADRILPYLIQKMDAKSLQTLIQKVDGKVLAAKILPHLQVKVGASAAYTPNVEVKKEVAAPG